MLNDFIYLNYANDLQQVYQRSLTADDLSRMHRIRAIYDPSYTFKDLWKGGFKLPDATNDTYVQPQIVL